MTDTANLVVAHRFNAISSYKNDGRLQQLMLSPARVWLALDSCFAVPICSAFLPNGLTFSSHNSWMLLGSLPFLIFLVQSVSCAVLFASWYSSRPHCTCCALAMRVIVIPALRLRMFYSDMRSSFRKYRLNTELTQKSNEDSIFHFPCFIFHFSFYHILFFIILVFNRLIFMGKCRYF